MAVASLYVGSARAFAHSVAEIPTSLWSAPALGEWNVRALVGHTARAIDTVLEYLQHPVPASASLSTAESYYAALRAHAQAPGAGADADAIAARGVAAGGALGDEPAAAVRAKADAVERALVAAPNDRLIAVRGASMPLEEYLRTRLFELVVHSLDIDRATGTRTDFPDGAVLEAIRLAVGIAEATGTGEQVLLALTGRGGLPPGYSVV